MKLAARTIAFLAIALLLSPIRASSAAESGFSHEGAPRFVVVINVSNIEKSVDFYTRIVGLKEVMRQGDPNKSLTVLLSFTGKDSDYEVGLIYEKDRKEKINVGNGLSRIAFIVPDVAPVLKKVADAGYEITTKLTEVKAMGITYSFVKDPDGYSVEIEHRRPPPPK